MISASGSAFSWHMFIWHMFIPIASSDSPNRIRRIHGCRPNSYNLSLSNHASVSSLPNLPSPLSARSPTTAGSALSPQPLVRPHSCSAPSSNLPFSLFCSLEISPRHAASLAKRFSRSHRCSNLAHSRVKSIATYRSGRVLWEVPNVDHCGAIRAAPREFEHRLLAWFSR